MRLHQLFLFIIASFGILAATSPSASAMKCGKLDLSGDWQSSGQQLSITQLGCDSATLKDATHNLSYSFIFDAKTRTDLPQAWLSFLRENLKLLHHPLLSIESGNYISSIQNDENGTFIKIEATAQVKYRSKSGKIYTIDVGGDAIISAREKHQFNSTCSTDSKEVKISIWVGHLRILGIQGGTMLQARAAALELMQRRHDTPWNGALEGFHYNIGLTPPH